MQRPFHIAISLALTIAAAAAHAQPAANTPETSRAGTAKIVSGAVSIVGAAGERALQPGDAVGVADRVVTGADGAASMVLRDGTTMVVGKNSQLELKDFAYNSTTQAGNMAVSLVRGTLRMITGLIGKGRPDAVTIATPTATVGIRGTDFIVQVDEAVVTQ
jgi:hypothetical protein